MKTKGTRALIRDVRFSNRPFEVKQFQTIRHCNVDVAHGLALLFGIGTRALPSWDGSPERRFALFAGLKVRTGPAKHSLIQIKHWGCVARTMRRAAGPLGFRREDER
jgi:hypothetical protein